MADDRPPAQDRRLLYVAPVVIAGLVIAIGIAIFIHRSPAPPVASAPPEKAVVTKPAAAKSPVLQSRILGRGDLIAEARQATDEFTVYGRLPSGIDALIGKRFS